MHVGARYDSAAATIALRFPIIDRVVLLRPQDSASATGLFLRLPRRDRYVYRPPPALPPRGLPRPRRRFFGVPRGPPPTSTAPLRLSPRAGPRAAPRVRAGGGR